MLLTDIDGVISTAAATTEFFHNENVVKISDNAENSQQTMGDQVRNRLVQAIEVLGGLDGIIAGALTTMQGRDHSGDQMKDMLTQTDVLKHARKIVS